MPARISDMTTQTATTASTAVTNQGIAVPTQTAQGVKTCAPVDQCVPSLTELEKRVAPKLRELGVTRAMFEGEFVRASKWGDARLSDELGLVVFSDREFDEFYEISCEILKNHKLYIQIHLWETDSILPESSLDDFAYSRYEDWKVISL